jgi:hypothetical protein
MVDAKQKRQSSRSRTRRDESPVAGDVAEPWFTVIDWTPGRELTDADRDRLGLKWGLDWTSRARLREPWTGAAKDVLDAFAVLPKAQGHSEEETRALATLTSLAPRDILAIAAAVQATEIGLDVPAVLVAESAALGCFSTAKDRKRRTVGSPPSAFFPTQPGSNRPRRNEALVRILRETPHAIHSLAVREAVFQALQFWAKPAKKRLLAGFLSGCCNSKRRTELFRLSRDIGKLRDGGMSLKDAIEAVAKVRGWTPGQTRGWYEDSRRFSGIRTKS